MAHDDGISAYSAIVEGIGWRILHAEKALSLWKARDSRFFYLEEAALQLRMICETTLLATFSLHSEVVGDLLSGLRKNDRWDKLRKILERENPSYMPVPISSARSDSGVVLISALWEDYVSGSDIFGMWGGASELLHCRNPLKPVVSEDRKAEEFQEAVSRLKKLMEQHAIFIPSDGMLYLVNVDVSSGCPDVHWWTAAATIKGAGREFLSFEVGENSP